MKVAVVIGASRGIGLELASRLVENGWKTYGTCRKRSTELESATFTVVDGVDVDKEECIQTLKNGLQGEKKIDLLVYNSGIAYSNWADVASAVQVSKSEVNRFMSVNCFGLLYAVRAFEDKLDNGSTVFATTSRMGSIEDNGSGRFYEYRMSKAALNMLVKTLSVDYNDKGVTFALVHPGMVATEMTQGRGIPISECVDGFMKRIEEIKHADTGKFYHATTGEILPW
mmetsp:Transcript_5962/g.9318  ORF Transcript_5962/g.9318 Transcript_5962/m.9318 type:complete len:227 (-) Transcript_5962:1952-2632(-)|eukprot:CAMPEP_0203767994 /NCGR_PEP_ID=MMETSP0099_2-20121227/1323_1 /ASSEMBLY_ACC=CAM_ASM_000209 /TAXON_ID=96639 /ORGANISM=" , Strain NY0313808BC1" /LENGTH=226 /DNA_ID=CAMNT_0050664599 /DNA_START=282 /DNA_END=962 /DNA_ORIENTATION=+